MAKTTFTVHDDETRIAVSSIIREGSDGPQLVGMRVVVRGEKGALDAATGLRMLAESFGIHIPEQRPNPGPAWFGALALPGGSSSDDVTEADEAPEAASIEASSMSPKRGGRRGRPPMVSNEQIIAAYRRFEQSPIRIAAALGMNPNTVSTRLTKLRAKGLIGHTVMSAARARG